MRRDLGNSLGVLDNTGVLAVRLLSVINRKFLQVGAFLLVSIKSKYKMKKTIKKKILFGYFTQNTKPIRRRGGDYYLKFNNRGLILLTSDKDNILGTKVFTPLTVEFFRVRNNPAEVLLRYFRVVV